MIEARRTTVAAIVHDKDLPRWFRAVVALGWSVVEKVHRAGPESDELLDDLMDEPGVSPNRHWCAAEDWLLDAAFAQGLGPRRVAQLVGRSESAVRHRAQRRRIAIPAPRQRPVTASQQPKQDWSAVVQSIARTNPESAQRFLDDLNRRRAANNEPALDIQVSAGE